MKLTESAEWRSLASHAARLENVPVKALFAEDGARPENYSIRAGALHFDYSRQRLDSSARAELLALAASADLAQWRQKMFAGESINLTENRAVLHVALRAGQQRSFSVNGRDVSSEVHQVLDRMQAFCADVHEGRAVGATGKRFTDVVNIGIGGSDLGPKMVVEALQPFADRGITGHFVSNVDGAVISDTLARLNPESTLIVVTSKTFTTQETLANAQAARRWLVDALGEDAVADHFAAVSTQADLVAEFGINVERMFGFWDWVGGRYSLWSAVGLPIALALGMDRFRELLAGAEAMDEHFESADAQENMPVMMALLGVWNTNFLRLPTQVVVPYCQYLCMLPAYLQQLEMESNGKSVHRDGSPVAAGTTPVLWGDTGTNGQHAFFQLLHQGTVAQPVDFILPVKHQHALDEQHHMLIANCLAQAAALMLGKDEAQVRAELSARGMSEEQIDAEWSHRHFPGSRPSTVILVDELTPKALGQLIALYEHKVFVQSVIWGINAYDQWGVELGKQLASQMLPDIGRRATGTHDEATNALLGHIHRLCSTDD